MGSVEESDMEMEVDGRAEARENSRSVVMGAGGKKHCSPKPEEVVVEIGADLTEEPDAIVPICDIRHTAGTDTHITYKNKVVLSSDEEESDEDEPRVTSTQSVPGEMEHDLHADSTLIEKHCLTNTAIVSSDEEDDTSTKPDGEPLEPLLGKDKFNFSSDEDKPEEVTSSKMTKSPSIASDFSESEVGSQSSDSEDYDSAASDHGKKSKTVVNKRAGNATCPLPDPSNIEQLSSVNVSKHDLRRLGPWAFLVVLDDTKRRTWFFPVRDTEGRINRPLLAAARNELVSGKRGKTRAQKFCISEEVWQRFRKLCRKAWPGTPVPSKFSHEYSIGAVAGNKHWLMSSADARLEAAAVLEEINEDADIDDDSEDEELEAHRILESQERKKVLEMEARRRQEEADLAEEKRQREASSLLALLRAKRKAATAPDTLSPCSRILAQRSPRSRTSSKDAKLSIKKGITVSGKSCHTEDRKPSTSALPDPRRPARLVPKPGGFILLPPRKPAQKTASSRQSNAEQNPKAPGVKSTSFIEVSKPKPAPALTGRAALRANLRTKAVMDTANRHAILDGYRGVEHQMVKSQKRAERLLEARRSAEAERAEREEEEEEEASVASNEESSDEEEVQANETGKEVNASDGVSTNENQQLSPNPTEKKQVTETALLTSTQGSKKVKYGQVDPSDSFEPNVATEALKALNIESTLTPDNDAKVAKVPKATSDIDVNIDKTVKEVPVAAVFSASGLPIAKIVDASIDVAKESEEELDFEDSNAAALVENEKPRKENKSSVYLKVLEKENKLLRAKKARGKNKYVDAEASEEEEEEGFGDYGDGELRKKRSMSDELDEYVDGSLNHVTSADIEGVVDEISDDEGEDGGDISELHRELVDKEEEANLERIHKGLRDHTLISDVANRRKKSTRLNAALEDGSDEEDTDEEDEMAKEERYRAVDQSRREQAAQASEDGKGETVEEVDIEAEQQALFLRMAKLEKQRRKQRAKDQVRGVTNGLATEDCTRVLKCIKRTKSLPSRSGSIPLARPPLRRGLTLERQTSTKTTTSAPPLAPSLSRSSSKLSHGDTPSLPGLPSTVLRSTSLLGKRMLGGVKRSTSFASCVEKPKEGQEVSSSSAGELSTVQRQFVFATSSAAVPRTATLDATGARAGVKAPPAKIRRAESLLGGRLH